MSFVEAADTSPTTSYTTTTTVRPPIPIELDWLCFNCLFCAFVYKTWFFCCFSSLLQLSYRVATLPKRDTGMDSFSNAIAVFSIVILLAFLRFCRQRKSGETLSSEGDSPVSMAMERQQPQPCPADQKPQTRGCHAGNGPFHVIEEAVLSAIPPTHTDSDYLEIMMRVSIVRRNKPEDRPLSDKGISGLFSGLCMSENKVLVSQSCQTDHSASCTSSSGPSFDTVSLGDAIENLAAPSSSERNAGAPSSEGLVPEESRHSSSGSSDAVQCVSGPAGEGCRAAGSSDSTWVPRVHLSGQQNDEASDRSRTHQQRDFEEAQRRDPDTDVEDSDSASVASIDGSVVSDSARRLDDLTDQLASLCDDSGVREASSLSAASGEESGLSQRGETPPHPEDIMSEARQSCSQGSNTCSHNQDEQTDSDHSDDDDNRSSAPLSGLSAQSGGEFTETDSGINDDDEAVSDNESHPVDNSTSMERTAYHEAGHFVSSIFENPRFQAQAVRLQNPSFRSLRAIQRHHGTARLGSSLPSLAAISVAQMSRSMTPEQLRRHLVPYCSSVGLFRPSYPTTPVYRCPSPASLPQPPAYLVDPPCYTATPDDLPPAYSVTDPLVSQTEALLAQASEAVERTETINTEAQNPRRRLCSTSEVREEERHRLSSEPNQERSTEGTELSDRGHEMAGPVDNDEQRETVSEQPATSGRCHQTRGVSHRTERSSSCSWDSDLEELGLSEGYSPRTEPDAESTSGSEAAVAAAQSSEATRVRSPTLGTESQLLPPSPDRTEARPEPEEDSSSSRG